MPTLPAPQSPEWWVARLFKRLTDGQPRRDKLRAYYNGDHPLPDVPRAARAEFQRMLKMSRSNWCSMPADAVIERLQVDGFRQGLDGETNAELWRIWNANALDANASLIFSQAVVVGDAYALVWPNDVDPTTPLISPESADQCLVECYPGSNVTAAGLKAYTDTWTGELCFTLYLPDAVFKYTASKNGQGLLPRYVDGEAWPLANPLGEVPLVRFVNRPQLGTDCGKGEFEDVLDIQDRLNKTLFDRLMAQEYGSFRQRWATGVDIPVDDDGNPIEPFKAAVDRLWIAPPAEPGEDGGAGEPVKFGEFSQTDLSGYISSAEADIMHLAALTKTPPHYLLGNVVNLSGDALKTAETGLVYKVQARETFYGESLKRIARLIGVATGDDTDLTNVQVVWHDAESRQEAIKADAAVKLKSIGVPLEIVLEFYGFTPDQITRAIQAQTDEAQRTGLGDLSGILNDKTGYGDTAA